MAKRVHLSSAALIGSLLHAGTVSALGLGDITLNSYLNEPLDAEVRLIDTRNLMADEIKVRLAGVDDFERLGVDRNYFLTRIQFEVSIDPASNSGVIRLTTDEPLVEPFVDVIIEARWPTGRLLREYTVLVDPPVFREEPLTVSASEEVAAAEAAAREPAPEQERPAQATQESRGDRVATGRSQLPAGEMPQRAFSAETTERPTPGQRYMVRRDETLWQIASRGRPDGSSVQQAMLDIQRLNPEAFIDGNINRVKAGYIIYLPDEGDISSSDLSEALAEVQQQNADWASGQATPGVTRAASLRISADVSEEPAEPDSDQPTEDARVANAGAAATPDGAGAARDVPTDAASADEPAAQEAAGATEAGAAGDNRLAAEVASMAERLDTLEQIVALKDEQIASLEQALSEARASAQRPAAQAATEQPTQRPAPAPDASDSGAAGGLAGWMYAAGAALIAALLGLLLWRRRRSAADTHGEALAAPARARDEPEDDVFAGVTLREEPAAAQKPPATAVTGLAPESEASPAASERNNRGYGERRYDDYIDDADAGDALAEADIYIAYGRYLQAAELLNTAIEGEPDNVAYRLKLIELYVDMGEPAQAEEQLTALRGSGDRDAVRRAEAIVSGSAAPAASDSEMPRGPGPVAQPADESITPGPVLAGETVPEIPEAAPAAGAQKSDDEPLEFGLDEEDGLQSEYPAATSTSESNRVRADEAETLELELDFDDLAIEEEGSTPAPGNADDELDLSEALEEADPAAGSAEDAADSEERGSEEMLFAADADQVATRLDLARAYLDMGDDDGARGILEQVISDGSQEQQREARALLDRID